MTYRFLGIEGEIGRVKLERFGQPVELTEADGNAAIVKNFPILPDAEFSACKFTEQELDEFATPAARTGRPDEPEAADRFDAFHRKALAARLALHDLRERLKAGPTPAKDGE